MYVTVKQKKIEVKKCLTIKDRFRGLMLQKNIQKGVLFPHCRSIHTCFMREPITVVFTTEQNEIVKVFLMNPWHIYIAPRSSKQVYELPKEWYSDFQDQTVIKVIE